MVLVIHVVNQGIFPVSVLQKVVVKIMKIEIHGHVSNVMKKDILLENALIRLIREMQVDKAWDEGLIILDQELVIIAIRKDI